MQKEKNVHKMITKAKYLFIIVLVFFMTMSCNTMKINPSNEAYEVINSYYGSNGQKSLAKRTIDISSYSKGLDDISAWQDANNDLGNMDRPRIDFPSMFNSDEFSGVIKKFVGQGTVKLDKKKLNGNIELKQKAKNSISFPYIFTNNGTKYALMYVEVTEGPENATGGITMFRLEKGVWKDIFYFHLWIS